ncbi:unnamed protein product [Protopolystoma xenopodis]|uniref:Uncharacterized protein n=1 Tax=Protopolystoma xenopodis TaxID=117903 RepID=A0A448WIQ6_9PLAT|nr:unnamed protein product [Protopolystoma xenopodis]
MPSGPLNFACSNYVSSPAQTHLAGSTHLSLTRPEHARLDLTQQVDHSCSTNTSLPTGTNTMVTTTATDTTSTSTSATATTVTVSCALQQNHQSGPRVQLVVFAVIDENNYPVICFQHSLSVPKLFAYLSKIGLMSCMLHSHVGVRNHHAKVPIWLYSWHPSHMYAQQQLCDVLLLCLLIGSTRKAQRQRSARRCSERCCFGHATLNRPPLACKDLPSGEVRRGHQERLNDDCSHSNEHWSLTL